LSGKATGEGKTIPQGRITGIPGKKRKPSEGSWLAPTSLGWPEGIWDNETLKQGKSREAATHSWEKRAFRGTSKNIFQRRNSDMNQERRLIYENE